MSALPHLTEDLPVFIVFETVQVLVLLTMILSRRFKKDRRALPPSAPLPPGDRRCDVLPWPGVGRKCLRLLKTSDLSQREPLVSSVSCRDSGLRTGQSPQESSKVGVEH